MKTTLIKLLPWIPYFGLFWIENMNIKWKYWGLYPLYQSIVMIIAILLI